MSLNEILSDIPKPWLNARFNSIKVDHGVIIPGLSPNLPVQTDNNAQLISAAIDLTSSTQTTGIVPINKGGTNSNTALSNSALMVSSGGKIVEGTSSINPEFTNITIDNTVFATNLGAPDAFITNAYITNATISTTIEIKDPIITLGVGNGTVGDTVNEGFNVEYKYLGAPAWSSILRSPNDGAFYFTEQATSQPGPNTDVTILTRSNIVVDSIDAVDIDASGSVSGTWIGDVIDPASGGTGKNNGVQTITLDGDIVTAGDLITAGNFSLTLTTVGDTNVTFPTSGTLLTSTTAVTSITGTANRITANVAMGDVTLDIANTYVGQTSITTLGTIGTGTWGASLITGAFGGTGINNGIKTITLGGNLITSGAFNLTLTQTAGTNVTLPTTGTLSTLAGMETLTNKTLTTPVIASLTSGAGATVFNTAGSITFTNSTAPGGIDEVLYVVSTQNIASKSIDSLTCAIVGGDVTSKIIFDLMSQTTNKTLTLKAVATGNDVYTIPEVGATANFIMSEGTQTINGSKTFSSAILTPRIDTASGVALNVGNTTATSVVIGHGTIPITETGLISKPNQPLFIYSISTGATNITGDGTPYTIVFDTSIANVGSYFNGTTFTAPVTGKYRACAAITLNGISALMNAGYLIVTVTGTSAKTWIKFLNNPSTSRDTGNMFTSDLNFVIPMTATDQFTFSIQIFGGTLTAGTQGTVGSVQPCSCSCVLEC